jgi:hypothetical protein
LPNVILMPNIASQLDRHNQEAIATISDLLLQLESRLMRIATVIERCTDGEARHALHAQSASVAGLIAQAREKAARAAAMRAAALKPPALI